MHRVIGTRILEEKLKLPDKSFGIISTVLSAILTQVMKVGCCDEQVALSFYRLLCLPPQSNSVPVTLWRRYLFCLSNQAPKPISVTWWHAERVDGVDANNFLIINPDFTGEYGDLKSLKQGIIFDPMDHSVYLGDYPALLEQQQRIVSRQNENSGNIKVKFTLHMAINIPSKSHHHDAIAENLREIKNNLSNSDLRKEIEQELMDEIIKEFMIKTEKRLINELTQDISNEEKTRLKKTIEMIKTCFNGNEGEMVEMMKACLNKENMVKMIDTNLIELEKALDARIQFHESLGTKTELGLHFSYTPAYR